MKIALHDFAGHPFQAQLSRSLAGRGHEVLHTYCRSIVTPRGALSLQTGDPGTLTFEAVGLHRQIDKRRLVRRRLQEITYGRKLVRRIRAFEPDVVLSGNAPLDTQAQLIRMVRQNSVRFVFWAQDLIGVGAVRVLQQRLGRIGAAIGGHFKRQEGHLLRTSDAVVAITSDFLPIFDAWGVDRDRVHVIENWAPLSELPLRPKDNSWSRANGLHDRTVVLYSGTLGMKHNPALLVEAAKVLSRRFDLQLVVISEGPGAEWVEAQARGAGLTNLTLLPFQPFDSLPEVMGTADVLLALLEPHAGVFCVPSKVLTGLCSGKPHVLAAPRENLAVRILTGSGGGIAVDPTDAVGFCNAIARLVEDPEARIASGQRARRYAECTFDIDKITDRFEAVLTDNLTMTSKDPSLSHTHGEPARPVNN